jgi:hypothetical protein
VTADFHQHSAKRVHWGILILWGVSLWLRLKLAPQTLFAEDEARIFEMTSQFYADGTLPTHGAAVVYSGTSIPGSLLALLAGLPLWTTQGHPVGTAIAIACFNSWGVLMLYWVLAERLVRIPRLILGAWIFFSPWSLFMNSAVNPHFLIPFSVAWLWGLLKLNDTGAKKAIPSLVLSASIVLMAQLHLSAAAVAATTALLWILKKESRPSWIGTLVGLLLGGITLVPWLTSPEVASSATEIGRNTLLHWDLSRPFQFFFRWLTFPTADVIRFITPGHGYQGLASLLRTQSAILVPAALALAGSLGIVFLGLHIFWKNSLQHRSLIHICGTAVTVTSLLYFFSIKGPSAHTFWIWFPISFIPAAVTLDQWQWSRFQKALAGLYLVSALLFSLGVFKHQRQDLQSKRLRVMDWTPASQP